MLSSTLEADVNQLHAGLCAGLADPKRILLLYTLAERPLSVNDLAAAAGMPQSSTSRHLRVLRERGMVSAVRQGQSVQYRVADARLIQALDLLRGVLRDHLAKRADLIDQLAAAEPAEAAQA
ncbi:MAG: winged helix-turn-helix transcriptional regulator [Anaerolineales bacterium]|nr:winged helix-turn-helix transcriptional regulator [Anaerolineales bacterium]